MNNKISLSVLIENARSKLTQAFQGIVAETNLPAYLLEGIILDILSEVRKQKSLEIIEDLCNIKAEASTKEDK